MRKFLIFFLAISFSQDFNWEVITSILNPTDVQILSPSEVYASTNGGVVKYSLDSGLYEEIGFDEGIHPLDLKSLKVDNNFLSLSDKDGTLQVYSFKDGYVDKVNHLDFIDEITDLNIFQDYLFAIGNNETKDGLLQFKGYGNQIYYNSFFQNFPISFSNINDIYIIDDVIYLGLDSGLISAKLNSSSLYLSSEWTIIDDQASVLQITDNFYFTYNSIKKLQDASIVLNINSKPIDSKYDIQSSTLNWIDEYKFYELDINGEVWEFVNPYDLDGEYISINAFDRLGYDIVIGIENHGLTHISRLHSQIQTYIPNSILSNQISALLVSEDGTLSGVGQKVGFYSEDDSYLHFYSMAYGYDYPNWNEGFPAYKLNYLVGNFFPTSILKSDRDTYLFNNYGIFLNSDISSGGVVEFNSINREVLIFGKDDGVLDGTGGIVSENSGGWYSRIPKLKKHLNGDIWVLNALAEHTNNIVAIQKSNGDWIHITAPDTNSYLPTDFDFGPNGFVWFGFKRFDDPYQYVSSGGLKILNTRNTFYDLSDDYWLEVDNPDILPGGTNQDVISLAFSRVEGQDILWIMGSSGIQGYLVSGTNLLAIYPQNFYGNLGFTEGDKLKIDSQNNVWIITQHSGVRIIKSNTEQWPDENGFTSSNSGLLSNTVYDVAFDNSSGRVYFATKSGINILKAPFALDDSNNSKDEISISPNPIFLPSSDGLSIFSFPSGSNVKIMTLSGLILKEFNMKYSENVINGWDCRMDNGKYLSSGVYLVASSHPTKGPRLGKLAVINR